MSEPGKTFGGNELKALIKQGKEVWNDWAKGEDENTLIIFENWRVDRHLYDLDDHKRTNLSYFNFPGTVAFKGTIFPHPVVFANASFGSDVFFENVAFEQGVEFSNCKFRGRITFINSRFNGSKFDETAVLGKATFKGTEFLGETSFDQSEFEQMCGFDNCTFREASFDSAQFHEEFYLTGGNLNKMRFYGTIFDGAVAIKEAEFKNLANFSQCQFKDKIVFQKANFAGGVKFRGTKFNGTVLFEENCLLQGSTSDFTGSSFKESAIFESLNINKPRFEDASFEGGSSFEAVKFHGESKFDRIKFKEEARFSRCIFDEDASFNDAEFKGLANFEKAVFVGNTDFESACFEAGLSMLSSEFRKTTTFSKSTFDGSANFEDSIFNGLTKLTNGVFNQNVSFRRARFGSALDASGCKFKGIPDLRLTSFSSHMTISNCIFASPRNLTDPDAADCFRRLKEIAATSKDHGLEQDLFALEMQAVRKFKIASARGKKRFWVWCTFIPNYLYQLFSNFGRSLIRPFLWLAVTWIGFAAVFLWASRSSTDFVVHVKDHYDSALVYSGTLIFPFFTIARFTGEPSRTILFGNDVKLWIEGLGFLEGVLGLVLIFLIGLALRNRFRI